MAAARWRLENYTPSWMLHESRHVKDLKAPVWCFSIKSLHLIFPSFFLFQTFVLYSLFFCFQSIVEGHGTQLMTKNLKSKSKAIKTKYIESKNQP